MTETACRTDTGSTASSPRLLALIESGQLDWDNPRHREAYLRAWAKGDLKPYAPGGGDAAGEMLQPSTSSGSGNSSLKPAPDGNC